MPADTAARSPPAAPLLACGNCAQPMQALRLLGHYGREVEVDLCAPCHLVWFDVVESARLGGPAMLALIGEMARSQSLAHEPLRREPACPRCHGELKTVHNRSRWGRSLQLECLQRHGAYQSFAQFLFEKGLVRALSSADRAALLARDGGIACVNCGAALGADDAQCRHCASVPSLVDVARLARALDPEDAIARTPIHAAGAERAAFNCMACGAALPAAPALQCAQCGVTLSVSRLADAHRQVAALEPALLAHARKPAPETVKRRLVALSADLPRQREYVARLKAENDAQDVDGLGGSDGAPWSQWRTQPFRAVLIALLLWFAWLLWG